jgi:UDP-N-acetylmuramate dehydrogenase
VNLVAVHSYTVGLPFPFSSALAELGEIPDLFLQTDVPLAACTRFGIGGPARILADSSSPAAFTSALHSVRGHSWPHVVIASGTNLIVSDSGFDGIVLRYQAAAIQAKNLQLTVDAGAALQDVVDFTINCGMEGIQSMTGIPGTIGAAVYGNAGAYGQSIDQRVSTVEFTDGDAQHVLTGAECEFEYRESIFKRRKDWVILKAVLNLRPGDSALLYSSAFEIRNIRDAKYPPTMKCAGSIFKNCMYGALPPAVQSQVPEKLIKGGKVPSAWFLEQVGAKGIRKGDIQVAPYHANLIYNDGNGRASDLVAIISDLKARVLDRFRFNLETEVQFVGFEA